MDGGDVAGKLSQQRSIEAAARCEPRKQRVLIEALHFHHGVDQFTLAVERQAAIALAGDASHAPVQRGCRAAIQLDLVFTGGGAQRRGREVGVGQEQRPFQLPDGVSAQHHHRDMGLDDFGAALLGGTDRCLQKFNGVILVADQHGASSTMQVNARATRVAGVQAASGMTCSPRFIMRRFAQAKMAAADSTSRISSGLIPCATSGCSVPASKPAGSSVSASAACMMARSRAVVPAVRGSVNSCARTSLRLASCPKRWAWTDVQYTQPLRRDTAAAAISRSWRAPPPGAYMIAL